MRRLHLTRFVCFRLLSVLFVAWLAASALTADEAPPTLRGITQSQWPPWPRVTWFISANDIQFAGRYAYVALSGGGLGVLDVRSPTNLVQVGGCRTGGYAWRVAVSGNYAYVVGGG